MASSKIGLKAVKWEAARIGISEHPLGSNRGPEIDKWNRAAGAPVGTAWCMAFQHAAFATFGKQLGGWASVESFIRWAKAHGYEVTGPAPGDLVCFDWENNRWADHVGIVEKRFGGTFPGGRFVGRLQTIEGNTGDAVRRRTRWVKNARFARIPD